MKTISLNHIACIICLFVLFSCKKDDPVNCLSWVFEVQNEATAISLAYQAYSLDESAANCNALKDAYQDYIDVLKPFGNCDTLTGQDRIEWQNTIDEAEEDIKTLC